MIIFVNHEESDISNLDDMMSRRNIQHGMRMIRDTMEDGKGRNGDAARLLVLLAR